jgi:hypothetical protein
MAMLRKLAAFPLPGAVALSVLLFASNAQGDEPPEYRLKTAILYSFASYTEWPVDTGPTIKLCMLGQDLFGGEIDALQGQTVGSRKMSVQRVASRDSLVGCQMVYIAPAAVGSLPKILESLGTQPVLTVADTPNAARQGVALNMMVGQAKISFEVNLKAARAAGFNFSSKLLRLAKEIHQ